MSFSIDTPTPDGDFAAYELAVLPRNKVHTIKFQMKLIPGANNDLVRISIDGQDAGQCFTTWENFYEATSQQVPISDRLLFLSGNRDGNRLGLLGGGYLFDYVTTTTSTSAGLPGCDFTIDKQADSPTVTAGSVEGYQITARNRGRLAGRNLLVCDQIPREATFVSANRKLRRIGRQRCLIVARLRPGQTAGFHIDLRVAAAAPPGNLDNIGDITPGEPPGLPPLPPLASLPLPDLPANVQAAITQLPPIAKVKVVVKILRAAATARPPSPPPVTG